MSLEYMQSFIKIGGVVFEKTHQRKHTDYRIYYQDKALKTAMFRNLFITIGPSIFSFSSSINFRTSSCKDSSIVDLPNPKSLRILKRNLLCSCQYFPYENECNLQSEKTFLPYISTLPGLESHQGFYQYHFLDQIG